MIGSVLYYLKTRCLKIKTSKKVLNCSTAHLTLSENFNEGKFDPYVPII